jgi:hypothetical protein
VREWTADFTNDPYDDYNLIIEILYDGEEVAVIRQVQQRLEMKLYQNKEDLNIPVDWLFGLLLEAKKRISNN